MSEPVHPTARYGLGMSAPPSEPDTEIHVQVEDAERDDGRFDMEEAPDATRTWEPADQPLDTAEETTEFVQQVPEGEPLGARRSSGPAARFGGALNHTTGIWIGLGLVAIGFAAIFYTWSEVAGLTNVAQQVPYLVSGGMSGLALVIAGVTVVDVFVRRQDSSERKQQLTQMTRALSEVRELLESEPDNPPEDE